MYTSSSRGNIIFRPNAGKWILLLFTLLALPNIIGVFLLDDLAGRPMMKLAYIGFAFILWLIPVFFLRLRTYFLVMSIFLILSPIEMAHIIFFHTTISEEFLSTILHTNLSEAWELLSSLKAFIFLYFVIIAVYFVILFIKIKNNYLFTSKATIWLASLCLAGNVMLYGAMLHIAYQAQAALPWQYAADNFLRKYRKLYPIDIVVISYRTYSINKEIKNLQKNLASFSFEASRPMINEREIYVVVIGESARYANFSINGYPHPTSPLLEKTDGLLSYSDVMATSNLTIKALPLLLTRATPQNTSLGYSEKSFVDAFAECGFNTAWIANQSSYFSLVARIAQDADYYYFLDADIHASVDYDEKLLPHFEKVLAESNQKQLIVLHTLGSHFGYNSRYPEQFRYFTPAIENKMEISTLTLSNKEVLINTYNNSIRYTSWFLSTVIERLKEENAISTMIYISDHAENLFDDKNNLILHGGGQFSVYEAHVPLFIWTSIEYEKKFPDKRIKLEENINASLSTDNLFYTVLDIADIKYKNNDLTKSFASPRFEEGPERFFLLPDNSVISYSGKQPTSSLK